MNPRLYAQLLYETLKDKSDNEREKIIKRFNALLEQYKISHLKNAILKEFKKIEREIFDAKITYITGSPELTGAIKNELESMFRGEKEFMKNPNVIGGVAVRQKDILYNGTLKKRIEILKSRL